MPRPWRSRRWFLPASPGPAPRSPPRSKRSRSRPPKKPLETPPPAAPPAPPPASRNAGTAEDDLTRIKGVGGKLRELLATLGVTRFAQIADWSEADIDRVDAQLGRFQGRIRRDNWVEQARLLAEDDTAGYEAKFGRL